jgi:hypothetical protein
MPASSRIPARELVAQRQAEIARQRAAKRAENQKSKAERDRALAARERAEAASRAEDEANHGRALAEERARLDPFIKSKKPRAGTGNCSVPF